MALWLSAALISVVACGVDEIRHDQPPGGPLVDAPVDSSDWPDAISPAERPTFEQSYKQGCLSNFDCANELTCINNVCDCCQTFSDDTFGEYECVVIAPEVFVPDICQTRPVTTTGPSAGVYLGSSCDPTLAFHQNCPPQLVCVGGDFVDECMCCDKTGDSLTCSTSVAFANAHCLN